MQNKRTEALFPPLHNNNRFIGASVSSAIIAIRFGSAKRRYISGWLYLAVTILTRTQVSPEQRVSQPASQQRCSVVNDAGCRVLVDIFMYCVYKSQGQHWVVVCPIYVHICPYLLILFGLLLRLWSADGAAAVQQWLNVCHPSID